MDNTQTATVISGPATGKGVQNTPNNQATTGRAATLKIAPDVDTKVSTDEAQRKTAIWVEIFYAFCFLMVGFILGIYGLVWLADPSSMGAAGNSSRDINSYFAMGIVGMALIMWGIVSVIIAAGMQAKNKENHKVANMWGILNWFTLNPFSWSMIRQSNGYVSKKQKAKIAKAAAAANSQDAIDEAADVQQEQQDAVNANN